MAMPDGGRGRPASYNKERGYFRSLKENVSWQALAKYEQAIKTLLERYNTTIYENRFIAGGAVEVFTLMLLCSAGIPAQSYGDETAAGDVILPNKRMLSIKGSFTGSKDSIRLINTMGETKAVWCTATLFIITGLGIVYGDPVMLEDGDLSRAKDALMLRRAAIDRFASDPANLIAIDIAQKPSKQMTRFSHKASTAVARQIMYEQQLKTLLSQVNGQHSM